MAASMTAPQLLVPCPTDQEGEDHVAGIGPHSANQPASGSVRLVMRALAVRGATMLLALLSSIVAASPAAAAPGSTRCDGMIVTELGTEGRDRLPGTPGGDGIAGLGGADRIEGRGGADVTCGGLGDDRIDGGAGSDQTYGGAGDDRVRTRLSDAVGQVAGGDRGQDMLAAIGSSAPGLTGLETGVLRQTAGRMNIAGTPRHDRIVVASQTAFNARGGRDRFVGSNSMDTFDGGSGRDTYEADRGGARNTCVSVEADPIDACAAERVVASTRAEVRVPGSGAGCGGERATIVGTAGPDRLVGTPRRDVIAGLAGDDLLVGYGGDDLLCGGRGSDGLLGGLGDDRLETGPGLRDQVSWDDADQGVTVDLVRGTARGEGRDRVFLGAGVVHLTAYDDTFVGTGKAEQVHAGDGDDALWSGPGNDVLHLDTDESTGDDTASAGRGDDEIRSLGGHDRMLGKAGRDYLAAISGTTLQRVRAGAGRDVVETVLPADAGNVAQLVTGGADRDRILVAVWPQGDHAWDLDTGVLELEGGDTAYVTGFERHVLVSGLWTVSGTVGPDDLTALVGAVFHGLGGDDRYAGSPGDDTFDGGAGDDTYVRDPGGSNTCRSVEHDLEAVCAGP